MLALYWMHRWGRGRAYCCTRAAVQRAFETSLPGPRVLGRAGLHVDAVTLRLSACLRRDWDQSEGYPASLGNNSINRSAPTQPPVAALSCPEPHVMTPALRVPIRSAKRVKLVLEEFCTSLAKYLRSHDGPFESIAERRLVAKKHDEVRELFLHRCAGAC